MQQYATNSEEIHGRNEPWSEINLKTVWGRPDPIGSCATHGRLPTIWRQQLTTPKTKLRVFLAMPASAELLEMIRNMRWRAGLQQKVPTENLTPQHISEPFLQTEPMAIYLEISPLLGGLVPSIVWIYLGSVPR